jgi:phage N-6-adenine-methyltransferase
MQSFDDAGLDGAYEKELDALFRSNPEASDYMLGDVEDTVSDPFVSASNEAIQPRNVHFSSKKDTWGTPWKLFNELSAQYGPFDLDVCALPENAKCPNFFSPEQDGLSQVWRGKCWCNPPYSRQITAWLDKAVREVGEYHAKRVVCLLPARTDTKWWHDLVVPFASDIKFLRGRVKFQGSKNSAPFPSCIVVFEF